MDDPQKARDRAEIVLDLLERYYDRAYAFARKSADAATAEDAVQEAFTRLLGHPRLEEMSISIGYLLRTIQNILRRRFSRAARLREMLQEEIAPGRARRTRGRLSEDERFRGTTSVDLGTLQRAMDRLGGDERDALRLIVCEGLSYAEAARSLGVTVSTINNWKHRGLGRLRKLIEAERLLQRTDGERTGRCG